CSFPAALRRVLRSAGKPKAGCTPGCRVATVHGTTAPSGRRTKAHRRAGESEPAANSARLVPDKAHPRRSPRERREWATRKTTRAKDQPESGPAAARKFGSRPTSGRRDRKNYRGRRYSRFAEPPTISRRAFSRSHFAALGRLPLTLASTHSVSVMPGDPICRWSAATPRQIALPAESYSRAAWR